MSIYCQFTLGPAIGLLWTRHSWIPCCQTQNIFSSPYLTRHPCGIELGHPVLLDTLSIMGTMVPGPVAICCAMQRHFGEQVWGGFNGSLANPCSMRNGWYGDLSSCKERGFHKDFAVIWGVINSINYILPIISVLTTQHCYHLHPQGRKGGEWGDEACCLILVLGGDLTLIFPRINETFSSMTCSQSSKILNSVFWIPGSRK